MVTIGNIETTKHTYHVGTEQGKIEVHANSRTLAASAARKAGYTVRDVNMIG